MEVVTCVQLVLSICLSSLLYCWCTLGRDWYLGQRDKIVTRMAVLMTIMYFLIYIKRVLGKGNRSRKWRSNLV